MDTGNETKPVTMRHHWFNHVAKRRKQLTRARKTAVSHREAMREASTTWQPIKERLQKKIARAKKRAARKLKDDATKA